MEMAVEVKVVEVMAEKMEGVVTEVEEKAAGAMVAAEMAVAKVVATMGAVVMGAGRAVA